jgi:hypothetical protein
MGSAETILSTARRRSRYMPIGRLRASNRLSPAEYLYPPVRLNFEDVQLHSWALPFVFAGSGARGASRSPCTATYDAEEHRSFAEGAIGVFGLVIVNGCAARKNTASAKRIDLRLNMQAAEFTSESVD